MQGNYQETRGTSPGEISKATNKEMELSSLTNFTIVAGTDNPFERNGVEKGQVLEIEDFFIHPDYKARNAYADIAVVKIKPSEAQLWKIQDKKLINKGGDWKFQTFRRNISRTWFIPKSGYEGNIEDEKSGHVLGLRKMNSS